jgi:signal peptidase I
MNIDLAAILLSLVVISGIIWLFDIIRFVPKRKKKLAKIDNDIKNSIQKKLAGLAEETSKVQREIAKKDFEKSLNISANKQREAINELPVLIDLARSLFPVFLIVLLLRSFLVEPFRIPSGSMMPTLLVGDFILVNKYIYGIKLPVLNKKIIEIGKPERGDVAVFRYPKDHSIPYIKRVVGLPGDDLEYHFDNKTVYINGEIATQEMVEIYKGVGKGSNMTGAEHRLENLGNITHDILLLPDRLSMPSRGLDGRILKIKIPENKYFVFGDNRDNSRDSRYWGFVDDSEFVGKAFFIWMNWDWSNGGVDWKRLGTRID